MIVGRGRHVAGERAPAEDAAHGQRPDQGRRRVVLVLVLSAGAVVLLSSYPPSQNRIGVLPPLPIGSTAPQGGQSSGPRTVTGDGVLTRWGTVQVQIVVQGGRIVAARGVRYPSLNLHGKALNGWAVPVLDREAVASQGARLDGISGATVTTGGYAASLQSAIDRARL